MILMLICCKSGNYATGAVHQHDSLESYLIEAKHFEAQFQYDQARKTYDMAISETGSDAICLAQLTRLKGRTFLLSDQYDSALFYLERARSMADKLNSDTLLALADLSLGTTMQLKGLTDSAEYYFKESIAKYQASADTTGISKSYTSLAILYKYTGDFDKAIENALKAYEIARKYGNAGQYTETLINLGNIYDKLAEYDTALSCYQLAYQSAAENEKPKLASSALQNTGVIFYRWGKKAESKNELQTARAWYEQSVDKFLSAIEFSKSINDKRRLAMLYSNISILYRRLGQNKEAIQYAREAVVMSKEIDDITRQLNALNNLGLIYYKIEDFRQAKQCYLESFELAVKAKQKESIKKTCNNLSDVYEAQGDFQNALRYARLKAVYQDSVFNIEKQKLIEEHKTNYEIIHLMDLNQIKELDKKRIRAERNVTIGLSAFVVVVLVGLLIFFRMRARKNRVISLQRIQKLEDEKKLMAAQSVLVGQEKERERIARELHDGIGILLSTASIHFSSVEDKTDTEISKMLKKANQLLKDASKEVRQISHNMMPVVLSKFGLMEAIEDLFEDVDQSGDIELDLRLTCGDERLPENMEIMIFRIVQEMLNNTLKHAGASKLSLFVTRDENEILVDYLDDGTGFDPDKKQPGTHNLGLSGIRTRVEYLGGTLKLSSSPRKGTRFEIAIPIRQDAG